MGALDFLESQVNEQPMHRLIPVFYLLRQYERHAFAVPFLGRSRPTP